MEFLSQIIQCRNALCSPGSSLTHSTRECVRLQDQIDNVAFCCFILYALQWAQAISNWIRAGRVQFFFFSNSSLHRRFLELVSLFTQTLWKNPEFLLHIEFLRKLISWLCSYRYIYILLYMTSIFNYISDHLYIVNSNVKLWVLCTRIKWKYKGLKL